MHPTTALLAGIVDYAGLFPPAGLDMRDAVTNYSKYAAGADSWMLGRFVVPASRLAEFEQSAASLLPRDQDGAPWRLTALISGEPAMQRVLVESFNARHAQPDSGLAVIDALEMRAGTPEAIDDVSELAPATMDVYVEIPADAEPLPLLERIRARGARAKLRTGGLLAEAFPATGQIVRFMRACSDLDLPFKATAGLHHPLRARYRLTYDGNAAEGWMFGYLNLFLAAAAIRRGAEDSTVTAMLEETDPSALLFGAGSIAWRDLRFTTAELAATRASFAISFGSCSFREPVDELRALAPSDTPYL